MKYSKHRKAHSTGAISCHIMLCITSFQFLLSFMHYFHLFFIPDVAMVIIITMICKIYFPSALERDNPTDTMPGTRTYRYRRVSEDEINARSNNYYSSDDEEDSHESGTATTATTTTQNKADKSTAESSNHSNHLPDVLGFEQENTSKGSVLRRLAFCVIMLNVTFVTWGVLQERMLTRRYPRFTGEFFTYSYALVFTSRFWTLIMSGFLMIYLKPRRSSTTIIYEYSFPSISNMLSSWCQYESLRYVSFPAVTLFKSFKLAPVMAMGKFLGNKQCKFCTIF
jgi:hypothetical protein